MFDLRNARTKPFLDSWWTEIDRYSRRDQLSLNYILKQAGIEWQRLREHPNSVRNHPMFGFVRHDAGDGSASKLIEALQVPLIHPYAGPFYADIKDQRIAAQKHRRIDIVVCVHNAFEDVERCLETVHRARNSEHQRLIIIDDGSDQPTARYLEEFASNASIWIDANIMIQGDIHPLVEEFRASAKAVAAVPHPIRKTVYEEGEACIQRKKDDAEIIREQLTHYRSMGYNNYDLIESNLMMFDLRNALRGS